MKHEQADAAVQELNRITSKQGRKELDKLIDRLRLIVPIVREQRWKRPPSPARIWGAPVSLGVGALSWLPSPGPCRQR